MKRLTTLPTGGADEDNVTGGRTGSRLRLHLRHGMFDQAKNRVQVNGKRGAPLFIGHIFDGYILHGPDAMIGDQNIDPAEMFDCLCNQDAGRIGIGQVAGEGVTVRFAAFFCQSLRLRLSGAVGEDNFSAGCGK